MGINRKKNGKFVDLKKVEVVSVSLPTICKTITKKYCGNVSAHLRYLVYRDLLDRVSDLQEISQIKESMSSIERMAFK
jgi:hypothetical protein